MYACVFVCIHLLGAAAAGEIGPSGSDAAGSGAAAVAAAAAAAAATAAAANVSPKTSGAGRWILRWMRQSTAVRRTLLSQVRPAKNLKRAGAFSKDRIQSTSR